MAEHATQGWVGHTVLDRDGEKVGKVDQVYRDADSDRPTWAVVKTGVTRKSRFVPLTDASEEADETLRIAATKDQIGEAPEVEDRDRMTPEEESRLRRHYRDAGAAGSDRNGAGGEVDDGRGGQIDDRRGLVAAARERQREEFGGFSWGAAFFGWLVAIGIAALLTAILSAAGAATGLTEVSGSQAAASAETIGIVGGAVLLVILMTAYFAGGYVAGRLSRFDGARQGLGTWLLGLIVTILVAVAGAVFGSEYNVLGKLDLPRIPVDEGSLTTGGIIALAAVLVGTLLAALLGGKSGERYHKKVDRAGYQLASLSALAAVAIVIAGCGGGGSGQQSGTKGDAQKAVQDWLTAAVEQDGTKYCSLITKDLLEQMTGQQSDQAKTKCEDLVKSKSGSQLPISVFVETQTASKSAAETNVEASLPSGPVTLRQEDGEFKIDAVEGATASATPAPQPSEKKQPPKKKPKKRK